MDCAVLWSIVCGVLLVFYSANLWTGSDVEACFTPSWTWGCNVWMLSSVRLKPNRFTEGWDCSSLSSHWFVEPKGPPYSWDLFSFNLSFVKRTSHPAKQTSKVVVCVELLYSWSRWKLQYMKRSSFFTPTVALLFMNKGESLANCTGQLWAKCFLPGNVKVERQKCTLVSCTLS